MFLFKKLFLNVFGAYCHSPSHIKDPFWQGYVIVEGRVWNCCLFKHTCKSSKMCTDPMFWWQQWSLRFACAFSGFRAPPPLGFHGCQRSDERESSQLASLKNLECKGEDRVVSHEVLLAWNSARHPSWILSLSLEIFRPNDAPLKPAWTHKSTSDSIWIPKQHFQAQSWTSLHTQVFGDDCYSYPSSGSPTVLFSSSLHPSWMKLTAKTFENNAIHWSTSTSCDRTGADTARAVLSTVGFQFRYKS